MVISLLTAFIGGPNFQYILIIYLQIISYHPISTFDRCNKQNMTCVAASLDLSTFFFLSDIKLNFDDDNFRAEQKKIRQTNLQV